MDNQKIKITMLSGTQIVDGLTYNKGMWFCVDATPENIERFKAEPNRYRVEDEKRLTFPMPHKCLVETLADGLFPDVPEKAPVVAPVPVGQAVWYDVSSDHQIPTELDLVIERKESGYTRFRLNGETSGKTLKNQDKINKFVTDIIDAHNANG